MAIASDIRQQIRQIQDLKHREDYPAALKAVADLEQRAPDSGTSAALARNPRRYQPLLPEPESTHCTPRSSAARLLSLNSAPRQTSSCDSTRIFPKRTRCAAISTARKRWRSKDACGSLHLAFNNRHDVDSTVQGLQEIAAQHQWHGVHRNRAHKVDRRGSRVDDERAVPDPDGRARL